MNRRYVCIHAHFYQPPRENPWIDEVDEEKSAAPYHDWNRRITRECYAANTASRVLRNERIAEIINNFEKISFNIGPTLMSWLEKHERDVYGKILEADEISARERGGHGNALAQVYNHSIMPLNSTRDKITQIKWGIRDFETRFRRRPEGIWFAETAVDSESLRIAADNGIRFVVLAPSQAKRIRIASGDKWKVTNGDIDTFVPYICRPGGQSEIALFFYNGPLSHGIAFNGSLNDGVKLGIDFLAAFGKGGDEAQPRLVHIATDGESYGHHHRFGDMALASAIRTIEESGEASLTNYGSFLDLRPPQTEVEIVENSSWSCAHGIGRWKEDCGCSTGGKLGWNQKWRTPLRDAMDWLKAELDLLFESRGRSLLKDPWEARNGYIDVISCFKSRSTDEFFAEHAVAHLDPERESDALVLLEMQSDAMKMYTSCGWFFADISGLEAIQIMKYAVRAIDLAGKFSDIDLEKRFLAILEKAHSNVEKEGTGKDIYMREAKPLSKDPVRAAVQAVMLNFLDIAGRETEVFCFKTSIRELYSEGYMAMSLLIGWLEQTEKRTGRTEKMKFCLLEYSGREILCSIIPWQGDDEYKRMKSEISEAFRTHISDETIRVMKSHFGDSNYTPGILFARESEAAIAKLTEGIRAHINESFVAIFDQYRKFMEYFISINVPIPEEIKATAKFVFEKRLNFLFTDKERAHDHRELDAIFEEASRWGIRLGFETVRRNLSIFLAERLDELAPGEKCYAARISEIIKVLRKNHFELDDWEMENKLYPFYKAAKDPKDPMHGSVVGSSDIMALLRIFKYDVPDA